MIDGALCFVLGAAWMAWSVWLLHDRHTGQTWAEEVVREFRENFPGRCLICSYHHYGYVNGHTNEPKPEQHYCIEEKS